MKVLVIYRADPVASSQIPPQGRLAMIEATAGYVDELKSSGKITDGGFFVIDRGGACIFEVDGVAELDDLADGLPARPLCSIEVVPLLSTDEFREVWPKRKDRVLTALSQAGQ